MKWFVTKLAIWILMIGCGSWVPSKNRGGSGSGKANENVSATADVHLQQAIEIASDSTIKETNSSAGLSLVNLGPVYTCQQEDNGVTSSIQLKSESATSYPVNDPKWDIELKQELISTTTYASSTESTVLCDSNQKPVIVFPKIETVVITRNNDQSSIRTVKDFGTETVVEVKDLSKKGLVQMSLYRRQNDQGSDYLESRSKVDITIGYRVNENGVRTSNLETKIQTLADSPLIVTKDLDTAGAKSKIVSGKIQSINEDNKLIETSFQELEIDLQNNCRPTSGSVEGTVYQSEERKQVVESFEITFNGDNALIKFPDGGVEEVLLTGCGIF